MAISAGITVPHPMDMKGDLANNWAFFKESWRNYKIATLTKKIKKLEWPHY